MAIRGPLRGGNRDERPVAFRSFVPSSTSSSVTPPPATNDLRDDAERVMRRNFPKSEYYARGLNQKEPWWKLW